jgi:hypothetical protein
MEQLTAGDQQMHAANADKINNVIQGCKLIKLMAVLLKCFLIADGLSVS